MGLSNENKIVFSLNKLNQITQVNNPFTLQTSSVVNGAVSRDCTRVNECDCLSANKWLVNQSCPHKLTANVVVGQDFTLSKSQTCIF